MYDFFGTIAEAIAGHVMRRYLTSRRTASHLAAILVSLVCGLIFYVTYGIYELIFPAPNPMGNVWAGLLLISLGVAFLMYIFILIDLWVKNRRKQNEWAK